MSKFSTFFLFLIGIEYMILGFFAIMPPFLLFAAWMSFIAAVPMQLVEKAFEWTDTGIGFGPSHPAPHLEWGNALIMTMGITAMILGFLASYGAYKMYRQQKSGFYIWKFLIYLSAVVVIWNIAHAINGIDTNSSFIIQFKFLVLPSLVCAAVYAFLYRLASKPPQIK